MMLNPNTLSSTQPGLIQELTNSEALPIVLESCEVLDINDVQNHATIADAVKIMELCLTTGMVLFARIVNGFQPLTIFAKKLDLRCLPGYKNAFTDVLHTALFPFF